MDADKKEIDHFSSHQKPPINIFVLFFSALCLISLSLITIFYPEQSGQLLTLAQVFISHALSWYYTLLIVVCLVFIIWLALSRYGKIKLGDEAEQPDFSYLTWISMLFSAGIGIALVYFGAYEPLDHYFNPPTGAGTSALAAQQAMVITFLHWGIHGWALYALVGVVLAYYAYVEHQPLSLRTALYPICGKALTNGLIGDVVDSFGVIATVIAMVTNLGIGALLVQAGLNELFGYPNTTLGLIALIGIMTIFAAIIAVIGIEKGLTLLSKANIGLLCLLLAFVFVVGPTAHLLDGIVQNTGDYLSQFIRLSFNLYIYQNAESWRGLWTTFYWAWWIAWAPFVGLFIARISRGRTIRELIAGVLIVPLGFTLLWLSIFGNSALDLVLIQGNSSFGRQVVNNPQMAIFYFLHYLPWPMIAVTAATIISFILFFAPFDSGSLIISHLSIKTDDSSTVSPYWLRIFWCAATALVTIGLFLAGNFTAMQTAVILFGLPFSLVLILYMASLFKSLKGRA